MVWKLTKQDLILSHFAVLLDLEPLPITALEDRFQSVYKFSHFNPIQTQIFHCLYHTDTNALIGKLRLRIFAS